MHFNRSFQTRDSQINFLYSVQDDPLVSEIRPSFTLYKTFGDMFSHILSAAAAALLLSCPSLKFTFCSGEQPSNFGIAWQWWVRSVLHFPFSFLLLQGRVLPPPPLNHYSVVCHHHKVALSSLANSCLSTPDFQKKTYNCYSKNSRGNESFLWLFDSDKKNLKIKTNNRHDWQKPIFSFKLWDLYF